MKRILVGFIQDGKGGGVDKYLLTFLEKTSDTDVEIDFLTDDVHEELEEYLKKYNSDLYPVASLRHPIKQYRQVCSILTKKQYDIIYLNISTAIDCIAAFAAKKMGIAERIIHSHSSGNNRESKMERFVYNTIHKICRCFLYKAGTCFYGCSVKAGEWLFPKKIVNSDKFEVIYNAVDRNSFSYDETVRNDMRRQHNLENKFVIGHVGSFCYQKNHEFLIEVFEQVQKQNKDSVLVLVGQGVQFDSIKGLVKEKGIEESVRFLGWRSDAARLYQMMDVFVLPSRFEGLPIVGVEAQSAGLPCVFSDRITRESKIHSECQFLKLEDGPEKWAQFILKYKDGKRKKAQFLEEEKNYDLQIQKNQLRRIICR